MTAGGRPDAAPAQPQPGEEPAGRPADWGVTDLTVRFAAVVALDGVELPVPPGAVTAVVGGDGAGKTTLLRVLAGVQAPSAGRVRRPPARRIGFVSAGAGVYDDLTVAENLEFAGGAYGVRGERARRPRRAAAGRRTGSTRCGDRLAGDLSGGMRQKLAFVLAVLHEPRLLILDEPTTGVDPVSRADLWRLIAAAAAGGTAVAARHHLLGRSRARRPGAPARRRARAGRRTAGADHRRRCRGRWPRRPRRQAASPPGAAAAPGGCGCRPASRSPRPRPEPAPSRPTSPTP